jgi:formylglycine-generating enzyme required for sulfatase activity
VGRSGLVAVWFATAAACGRIGFDQLGVSTGDANRGGDSTLVDGVPTLSCAGLAAICGPSGTSSCCGSSLVPGGTFYRSYDLGSDGMYATMNAPATVSDFRVDTYEVTVGRFRQFVNAGMGMQGNRRRRALVLARSMAWRAKAAGPRPTTPASRPTPLRSKLRCSAHHPGQRAHVGVRCARTP